MARYEIKDVVCDYGIYEDGELKLILNSAKNAHLIKRILEIDTSVPNVATPADFLEVDKVAEMLRLMFADDCACNYNGNDEWLPLMCKYAETDCPMPKERLGCWKEFVKYYIAKMDERRGE